MAISVLGGRHAAEGVVGAVLVDNTNVESALISYTARCEVARE